MKKASTVLTLLLLLVLTLCGCTAESGENIAFGTFYNIKSRGTGASKNIKLVEELLVEIENQCSASISGSDVSLLNSSSVGTPIFFREHSFNILKMSFSLYEETNGAFNPAIYPVVELWNFGPDTFTGVASSIPTPSEIDAVLPICSPSSFSLDENNRTVTKLVENAKIDLGGIAKGYAVDKSAELLGNQKEFLVNVGGNMRAKGKKSIGIANPKNSDALFATFTLDTASVATSGDYERFYYFEGKKYHHIIGKNGCPAESGIRGVTVKGESATLCDAYSTSVFILGKEFAENIAKKGYSSLIIYDDSYETVGEFDINE